MRITGGAARSIVLKTADVEILRPATDMTRVSLFNSLVGTFDGARFLDLFAGCGAVGLEAFSRGAASGVFVEMHPRLTKIIAENLAAVAKSAQRNPADCEVWRGDVFKYPYAAESVDFIFCDPPYAMVADAWPKLCEIATLAIKAGGFFVVEHPAGVPLSVPTGFVTIKTLGGKGARAPNIEILQKI